MEDIGSLRRQHLQNAWDVHAHQRERISDRSVRVTIFATHRLDPSKDKKWIREVEGDFDLRTASGRLAATKKAGAAIIEESKKEEGEEVRLRYLFVYSTS